MEHSRSFISPGPFETGVVASSVYTAGKRVADIPIEEAGEWARKEDHFVWIGLLEPSRELLLRVQQQFQLHDLAIDDAEHPHARPKLSNTGTRSSSSPARPSFSTSGSSSAKRICSSARATS